MKESLLTFAVVALFMWSSTQAVAADLVQRVAESGNFTTLISVMERAGLSDTVSKRGPFTLFAPTDEAFAKIPPDEFDRIVEDKARLQAVLTYHLVPGRVRSDEASDEFVKTVQGQTVQMSKRDGLTVENAKVLQADIEADNGLIHTIDTVILPR